MPAAPEAILAQAFTGARTFNAFSARAVDDETLLRLYDLLRWGPTSMNCQPARYVFVRSAEAKQRLTATLSPGNVAKTMAAPVTAIVAIDTRFYEHLPAQFPSAPGARASFADNPALAESTAMRNGSLQGAYLILAARLLGLDCGPMSGFDAAKLNAAFFPDGRYKVNFLVNIGYGDPRGNHPRGPRLAFDEAARIL
ncbi:MAG: malonic semialdehyde reductase [Rhodocyclaceae bacterium]|nr:malonic semialdehyde reductase [Rhodocyclaceae bacterium]